MNIVVLAGGLSTEREVSLTSGSLIANALIRRGHRVALVDTYLGVSDVQDGALYRSEPTYAYCVSETVPDLAALRAMRDGDQTPVGPGVIELCAKADVVFNAMHGGIGENGKLQALLDCLGIRYTGTGALGATLSMDKHVTKQLLQAAGIDVPRGIVVDATSPDALRRVLREVGLPCVVKPACGGSSVGVSLVDTKEQLTLALQEGGRYETRLVIEQRVFGRELTVGMLDGRALPPIEIIPREGFYDYKNKYQSGYTTELCPAPLTEEQTERLQAVTKQGFEALQLQSYARFDYIMDEGGRFWCLEANALPGMTPTSLLPQMAAAIGMDYDTLCETIVSLAWKK